MKPIQIALRKEFKELNEEMDDVVINCIVPRIENIYIGFSENNIATLTKYRELVINVLHEINKNCHEENSDKLDENIKICLKYQDNFNKTVNDFNRILDANQNKKFLDCYSDDIFKESREICKKMNFLIFKAYKISDMKMANMVGGYINSVMVKIADIMNFTVKETIDPYIKVGKLIVDEIHEEYEKSKNHIRQYENKINKNLSEDNVSNPSKKIFSHKEMDKFLKSEGFEPIRQNGSHKIYTDGEKTTVVPQHTLGKGLSSKIQKQIK